MVRVPQSSPTLTFTGTGAFSGSTSNFHGALGIYSMIEGVTIAFNGPGTASFDYSADNTLVPEPSSLTLVSPIASVRPHSEIECQ